MENWPTLQTHYKTFWDILLGKVLTHPLSQPVLRVFVDDTSDKFARAQGLDRQTKIPNLVHSLSCFGTHARARSIDCDLKLPPGKVKRTHS